MAVTEGDLVPARIYAVSESGSELGTITIPCMFNPFEYTVNKSNTYEEKPGNGTDVPQVEFKKAGAQTLKLKLDFTTLDSGADVSLITNQLWKLMESKSNEEGEDGEKIPPPWVAFEWGVFRFVSVITQMSQKFTFFTKMGVPVRATADITFTQYVDTNDYPAQNPTSGGGPIERIRTITAGDRLDLIAAEVYGDATKWRHIAQRNNLRDPLALRPGMLLRIPKANTIS